jgi:hypothetical protein
MPILDIKYQILGIGCHQFFGLISYVIFMIMGGPFLKQSVLSNKKITSIQMQVGMQMSTFIGNLQGTTADELEIRPISIHQPLSSRPGCNCNSLMLLSLALLFHYSTLYNWVKPFLKLNSYLHKPVGLYDSHEKVQENIYCTGAIITLWFEYFLLHF